MNEELKHVVQQARRWVEQERAWDDTLYATVSEERGIRVSAKKHEVVVPAPATLQAKSRPSEPPKPFAAQVRPPARPPLRPASLSPRSSPAEVARKTEALGALYEKY